MWWWFVPSEPCSIPSFLTVQDWENVSHCHLPTLLTCQHSSPAQTPHLPTLFTCQHSSPADTPHLLTLLTCQHSSPAHTPHLPTILTCPHHSPLYLCHFQHLVFNLSLISLSGCTQVPVWLHALMRQGDQILCIALKIPLSLHLSASGDVQIKDCGLESDILQSRLQLVNEV